MDSSASSLRSKLTTTPPTQVHRRGPGLAVWPITCPWGSRRSGGAHSSPPDEGRGNALSERERRPPRNVSAPTPDFKPHRSQTHHRSDTADGGDLVVWPQFCNHSAFDFTFHFIFLSCRRPHPRSVLRSCPWHTFRPLVEGLWLAKKRLFHALGLNGGGRHARHALCPLGAHCRPGRGRSRCLHYNREGGGNPPRGGRVGAGRGCPAGSSLVTLRRPQNGASRRHVPSAAPRPRPQHVQGMATSCQPPFLSG